MSDARIRGLRWAVIALAIVVGLLQGAAAIAAGSLGWTQTISNGAIGTVGVLIWLRRPSLRVGQLLVVTAAGFSLSTLKETPAALDLVGGVVRDGTELVILASGVIAVAAISYALAIFPDGELPSSGWRWVNLVFAAYTLGGVAWMLGAELPSGVRLLPLGEASASWEERLEPMVLVGTGLVVVSLGALVVRFRRGSPIVRRQIGWVMYGLAVYIAFLLAVGNRIEVEVGIALDAVFFMGIPIAIGVAVFRYRLFDLDRVVNLSVVYLVVVGLLASAYFGMVYVLGTVLPFTSDLAVAASTLLAVGLFNPVRKRIQGFVDRRFFRSRFDAAEVLRSFAGQLRGPMDEGRLVGEVTEVLDRTMRPESVGVWLATEPSR